MTKTKDKMYVAAIKIGTKVSGLSYSLATEYQWRNVVTETWNCDSAYTNTVSQTLPSVLLITPDLKSCYYGYKAEEKYASMQEDETCFDKDEYYYFPDMSFLLTVEDEMEDIEDERGKSIPLSTVLRHIFNLFKDHTMGRLSKSHMARDVTLDDLGMVFVIPKWNRYLSSKMQEIAKEVEVDNMRVISEPMATLHYCLLGEDSAKALRKLQISDLAILNIEESFTKLSEVTTSKSKDTDKLVTFTEDRRNDETPFILFRRFLAETFGDQIVQTFWNTQAIDVLEMKRSFELMIRKNDRKLNIPSSFSEMVQDKRKKCGSTFTIKLQKRSLILSQSVIKTFYTSIDKTILDLLKKVFLKRKLTNILLTGQYAVRYEENLVEVSKYLNTNSIKVLQSEMLENLDDIELTSLKGAVYYGHDPWTRIFKPHKARENIDQDVDQAECLKNHDLALRNTSAPPVIKSQFFLFALNLSVSREVELETKRLIERYKIEKKVENVDKKSLLKKMISSSSDSVPSFRLLCKFYLCCETDKLFQRQLFKTGVKSKLTLDWYIKVAFSFHKQEFNEIKDIIDNIRDSESNRRISKILFEEIKNHFLSVSNISNIIRIWPGYHSREGLTKHRFDSLVIVTKGKVSGLKTTFLGYTLYFRDVIEVSKEERITQSKDQDNSVAITNKDADKLFRTHSNITLISSSSVKSSRFNSPPHRIINKPCIVIYCHVKGIIPMGEPEFPKELSGIEVDIREAVCVFAAGQRCLQIGDHIGPDNFDSSGTLGGFVNYNDRESNRENLRGFITCAHVVFTQSELNDGRVGQYAKNNEIRIFDKDSATQKLGVVRRAVFKHSDPRQTSVDAALVEIEERFPEDGCFSDEKITISQLEIAGFSEYNKPTFNSGETERVSSTNTHNPLIKVGATTGLTIGYLRCHSVHADVINNKIIEFRSGSTTLSFKVHGQMEVVPATNLSGDFLCPGDSGSFVFMRVQNSPPVLKCVGLAIAKTSHGSCIMTPIENVLVDLGLTINSLAKFQRGTNEVQQRIPTDEQNGEIRQLLENMQRELSSRIDNLTSSFDQNVLDINRRLDNTDKNVLDISRRLENTDQNVLDINRRLETTDRNILDIGRRLSTIEHSRDGTPV